MDLHLITTAAGVLLPVQGQPGARRNAVVGLHGGRLKVAVTVAPEKGKANAAILEVLADKLGLKSSQLSLHSGETNPRKVVLITGCSAFELETRITQALNSVG